MDAVVVILSDSNYFYKAKRTIIDCRTRGKWDGDIVYISVDFGINKKFLDFYNVIEFNVKHIDLTTVINAYKQYGMKPSHDEREFKKLTQWDKFYVFDKYFLRWKKVIYLDAGLRVFDNIKYLLDLPCEGKLLAPDDSPKYDKTKRFNLMLELDKNLESVDRLLKEYGSNILNERYFLNCIWIYDTQLLNTISFDELKLTMNSYPICRCNEMTIMNLIFTFKYKVWEPFPEFISSGKRLFGWSEHDRDYGNLTTWKDFVFIKYPVTINFECE
jgi:hypothetical protein